MAEHVIVRQNDQFEIGFWAQDSKNAESDEPQSVVHIHEMSPYTLLLASLGACTAIVLNSYAQNHDVTLQEVETHLHYQRVFADDCENCEEIQPHEDQIVTKLILSGDLTDAERQKLFHISKQCSVHKLLEDGIEIKSELINDGGNE